ncbi:MAG: hypothetical protein QMD11_01505 [Smithella sp.]|nr:hypothetical protein [Smithella sp.]
MQPFKDASVYQLIYSCARDNFALVSKIVVTGIVSRIAEIASFLLPVKIFLIAATKKIPDFSPEIFHQYDYRVVMVALALFSIFFYVMGYILNKYTAGKAGMLAMTTLGSTLKSKNVSDKQVSKIAARIFSSYIELFFILTVALLMALLSPYLLLSLVPYYAFVAIVIRRGIEKKAPRPEGKPDKQKDVDVEYNFSIYSDIGFIIGFLTALVISFQVDNAGMMYLFICFILMRRSQGSFKRLIKDYVFLKVRLIQAS